MQHRGGPAAGKESFRAKIRQRTVSDGMWAVRQRDRCRLVAGQSPSQCHIDRRRRDALPAVSSGGRAFLGKLRSGQADPKSSHKPYRRLGMAPPARVGWPLFKRLNFSNGSGRQVVFGSPVGLPQSGQRASDENRPTLAQSGPPLRALDEWSAMHTSAPAPSVQRWLEQLWLMAQRDC